MRDDVFQVDELVNAYQVAPSTELDEISNFHVDKSIFIDVNAKWHKPSQVWIYP